MTGRRSPKKGKTARRSEPEPEPVTEAEEAPEEAAEEGEDVKAPARSQQVKEPEPEDSGPDLQHELLGAALAEHGVVLGDLDKSKPGGTFPTDGYKLVPNVEDKKWEGVKERIKQAVKDGVPEAERPRLPGVHGVVLYLKDGRNLKYKKPTAVAEAAD